MQWFFKVMFVAAILSIPLAKPAVAQTESVATSKKVVLENLMNYWKAVRAKDVKSAAATFCRDGIYWTSSDGALHKPLRVITEKTLEQQWKNRQLNWQVYYPEAIPLGSDVMLVRYYLEGLIVMSDKSTPYRTRVTSTWVKKNGKWLIKSEHYSAANYGGVYIPTQEDFNGR